MSYNYLNDTKLKDLNDLKKIALERNESIDRFYYKTIDPTRQNDGTEREICVGRRLAGRKNKDFIVNMGMAIWKEYEMCRQFVLKTIEFCDNFFLFENSINYYSI